jgi:DNA-directed RNA polymerase subunit RPC12/RpoP
MTRRGRPNKCPKCGEHRTFLVMTHSGNPTLREWECEICGLRTFTRPHQTVREAYVEKAVSSQD